MGVVVVIGFFDKFGFVRFVEFVLDNFYVFFGFDFVVFGDGVCIYVFVFDGVVGDGDFCFVFVVLDVVFLSDVYI